MTALGLGNGAFATPTSFNLTGGDSIRSASLVAADFDGDTKVDLALLDTQDYSGVFYGKGDGTFTSVPNGGYVAPKDLLNIAAGGTAVAVDLNKDSKPDILAGNTILLNLYGAAPPVTIPTSPLLTASASSIAAGASITFTDLITPASGTGVPTGTVTFYDGTTVLGTGSVNSSGVATYTTTGLAAGTQSITAAYPGDANFTASTSAPVSVAVGAAIGTTTALTASTTNTVSGTSILFTATVTPASGTAVPTGTVTFYDGTAAIGTGTLTAGVATFQLTSTLSVAAHSITASYGGAATFSASTSSVTTVTITSPAIGTSTALAASATNAVSGTSITFTATVTPASGTTAPTGSLVTFFDGSTTLGLGDAGRRGRDLHYVHALRRDAQRHCIVRRSLRLQRVYFVRHRCDDHRHSQHDDEHRRICNERGQRHQHYVHRHGDAALGNHCAYGHRHLQGWDHDAGDWHARGGRGEYRGRDVHYGRALERGRPLDFLRPTAEREVSPGSFSTGLSVTITAGPPLAWTLALTAGSLTFVAGATSGNSTNITVTPTGGFVGSVALSAQVTTSPVGAINAPTLGFGNTSPVVISGASAGTGTLTVTTLAPTQGAVTMPGLRRIGGGAVLAGLLMMMMPARRRGVRMLFGLLLGFVVLAGGAIGCGGKGGGGSTSKTIPGTTTGAYVVTVTATSGTTTAQTTVNVNVQ